MKKSIKVLVLAILTISLVLLATGCSGDSGKIRIVHKNYTEQRLLGQMLSVLLESRGFETNVSELGGTMLCFNALKGGQADIYPEFTGTAYGAILDQTEVLSAEDTYNYVKTKFAEEYDILWLDPMGFNNTYVLSVTKETAEEYNLEKISDLIGVSDDWKLGSDSEFANRTDGYQGLLDAYDGLSFGDLKTMDQGLTYQALANNEIDVNVSYATDGRIAKFGLVNLEDDKNFFPPYYCAPIVKQSFADDNPEVIEALKEISGKWSDEEMQKYNLQVDEGTNAREVATQMLIDAGLIEDKE